MVTDRQPAAGLVGQLVKHVEIEPVGQQMIAGIGSHDAVASQHRSGSAEVDGDFALGLSGPGIVGPQALDQPIDAHGTSPGQRQNLDCGAGLATADLAQVHLVDGELAQCPDPEHGGLRPRRVP